jgi:hypothetical protein
MGKSLQFLLMVLVGIAIGFLVGPCLIDDARTAPPLTEETASSERLTALYMAAASTAATDSTTGLQRRVGGRAWPTSPDEDMSDEQVYVPSLASADELHDDDVTLIPRGPGKYAIVDLQASGRKRLVIHQGSMERDGNGSIEPYKAKPRVGVIRGTHVPVELLHLGFDEEGRAVIAHIRTTDDPPVEGIVILATEESFITIRPWRPPSQEADSEAPEDPHP